MTLRWRTGRTFALLAAGAALAAPAAVGLTATPAAAAPGPIDMNARLTGPATVVRGELALFTIDSVIPGPPAPTNVKLILTLPDGFSYAQMGGGSGPCTADAARRVVTCIPDPGEPSGLPGARQWEVYARASSSLAAGTELTTALEVTADGDETNPADNRDTVTTRVTGPAATSIRATGPKGPIVPGSKFRVTVQVHYADGPPIDDFAMFAYFGGDWFLGAELVGVPAQCSGDPGSVMCEIDRRVEPNTDFDLVWEFGSTGDPAGYHAPTEQLRFQTFAFGDPVQTSIELTFATATPGTPSPTPTGTGTGGGTGNGDGQAGGGLPITGTATGSLAATGVLLVAAGAGAVLLGRRRRRSSTS